jgi:hypothetical protein
LTTLYLAGAKNTDNWHARKGDLQHAFPLDILMVPSSMANPSSPPVIHIFYSTSCSPKTPTTRSGDLKFITDRSSKLSLSPEGARLQRCIQGHDPQWVTIIVCHPRGIAQRGRFGLERGGGLRLPSPEGMQRGGICHPRHTYTAAGRDPDVSHHTNEAAADHCINTPPRATSGSPGGTTSCPTLRHWV